jgi:lactate permease
LFDNLCYHHLSEEIILLIPLEPFHQIEAPINGNLVLSALVAVLPLLVLFVMLGVFKIAAWKASLTTLIVTIALAVFVWQMPFAPAFSATIEGIFFGICQIMWILIPAVWMYNLTVKQGWDKVLRDLLRSITEDLRILSILIAFCFGALLEALAGFGTPVAITAAMMVAAGMKPLKSAVVCMLANTAPVAFGAMGAPITALGTGSAGVFGDGSYDPARLADAFGAMAGRQSPFMAMIVPLFLVFLVDGLRGLKDTWHIALSSGVIFAIFQFLASNYIGYQITDVIASVACILGILLILRFVKPKNPVLAEFSDEEEEKTAAQLTTGGARVWGAVAPYAIVVVIFGLSQVPAIKSAIANWAGGYKLPDGTAVPGALVFTWPGLDECFKAGESTAACVSPSINLWSVLSTGTLLFIGGIITALIYKMNAGVASSEFGRTIVTLKWTIITIACVLGIAYIMNASGITVSLGTALALGTGLAFAFVSPILGWLGVAITGSDTSSNALFSAMQAVAANEVWPGDTAHQVLMVTSNSTGGCMGKMISPQSLSVAAAAAGLVNQEGTIFRKVIGWSLVLLVIFAVLVTLQATVLTGMIPLPAQG